MAESILVDIIFDVPTMLKNLAALNTKIIELKEAQKGLDKGSAEFARLGAEIKNTQAAAKTFETQLRSQMAITGKQANTLELMRTKLTGMKSALSQMEAGTPMFNQQSLAIEQLNTELKELEAAYGDNQREVGNYANATKSLRGELRQYTEQLAQMVLAGQKGTAEYDALAQKVGQMKDAMGDAGASVNSFADDTQQVRAISNSFSLLQQSMGQVASMMALTGANAGDISKVMAVMGGIVGALTVGQNIFNELQREGTIRMVWAGAATKATAAMQVVFGKSVIGASGALNLFGKALIATGIGAIVVALGLLIANFDKIVQLFSRSARAAKEAEDANKAYEESVKDISAAKEKLKLQQDDFIKNLELETQQAILAAKKQGKSAEDIAQITIDADKKKLAQLRSTQAEREQMASDEAAAAFKAMKAQEFLLTKIKEGSKQYEEATKRVNELSVAHQQARNAFVEVGREIQLLSVSIQLAEQAATETFKSEQKERVEAARAAAKERRDIELAAMRELEDELLKTIKDETERAIAQRELAGQREIEDLRKRLATERNLTAAARQAISDTIVLIEQSTAADVQQIRTGEQKATNERALAADQERISLLLEIAKEGSENEYNLKVEQIELIRQKRLDAENLTAQEIANINTEADLQLFEARKVMLDKNLAEQQHALENHFERRRQAAIYDHVLTAQINLEAAQAEYDALAALDEQSKSARFDSQAAYEAAMLAANARIIKSTHDVANAQIRAGENMQRVMQGFSSSITEMLGAVAGDTETFAKFKKITALAMAAVELGGAIAAATSTAIKGDPYTIAIRIAAAVAGVVGSFAAVFKSIRSAEIPNAPKFAGGGTVPGGQFSGDRVLARLNSGEKVLNLDQQSRLDKVLFGGATPQMIDYEALAAAMVAGVAALPPQTLDYKEFTDFQKNVIKIKEYASI